MNTLHAELVRLFGADAAHRPDGDAPHNTPLSATRTLVLELARPADWTTLSALWHGVQADLGLPAPAIAVNGVDGFQLWFSLVQAVPHAQASAFLEALRARYLPGLAPERLRLLAHHAPAVPALGEDQQRWSAFIAPDLASIFADEPWIDLPPGDEAQASVLARLQPITPALFEAAWKKIGVVASATAAVPLPAQKAPAMAHVTAQTQVHGQLHADPKSFLLAVMNDPQVDMAQRIAAAAALLPYFENPRAA